jgi:hypothetical protein
VGEPEQFAVSVTLVPAIGVVLLAETVHDGGAGSCQPTCTDAGAPLPTLFDPTTVYVTEPALAAVVLHVGPVELQLVHAYVAGLPLHEAVSWMLVFTVGAVLLDVTEHTGAVGVVGPPPPPLLPEPLQSMSMPARGPCPAPWVAASA